MAKPQVVVAPVLMSKLSANAPEFYPSGYSSNYTVSTFFFKTSYKSCVKTIRIKWFFFSLEYAGCFQYYTQKYLIQRSHDSRI
jgi:hypothetical protein